MKRQKTGGSFSFSELLCHKPIIVCIYRKLNTPRDICAFSATCKDIRKLFFVNQVLGRCLILKRKVTLQDVTLDEIIQNPCSIKYTRNLTPEMCLIAVQQTGYALQYVPREYQTPEMCLAVVQQNGYALRYVPWEHRTPEICLAAVQQKGDALQYIPHEFQTPKICLAAVQQNRFALNYVPLKET
jgi:hypothetical protein